MDTKTTRCCCCFRNRCMFGCPANSFCQFGFCECNPGLTKSMVIYISFVLLHLSTTLDSLFSGCLLPRQSKTTSKSLRLPAFPGLRLHLHLHGHRHEPHLQHQPHHRGPGQVPVQDQHEVEHRGRGMPGWFLILARCYHPPLKIYMDVDCSDITYDTPPSPTILKAVEKAKQRLNATEGFAGNV